MSLSQNPDGALLTLAPVWTGLPPENRAGFTEGWHFKVNDPSTQSAFWVRLVLLSSRNGFRKIAEAWAVAFERKPGSPDVQKTVIKQTYDIASFETLDTKSYEIRVGNCELSRDRTSGRLKTKGQEIEWDFSIAPHISADRSKLPGLGNSFNLIPESLARSGLIRTRSQTTGEDLDFSGTLKINGVAKTWKNVPGMQGHFFGQKNSHSWTWGHSNSFFDEKGHSTDFVFEGLTSQNRLMGLIPTLPVSSFYFRYQGTEYRFNTLWDSLRCRSHSSLNEWNFKAERGELLFRGQARADFRDFAGLTFEDTDGSLMYSSNSKLSHLTIHVYRKGKLEGTFESKGTAGFEVVRRAQNPYVPLLG